MFEHINDSADRPSKEKAFTAFQKQYENQCRKCVKVGHKPGKKGCDFNPDGFKKQGSGTSKKKKIFHT